MAPQNIAKENCFMTKGTETKNKEKLSFHNIICIIFFEHYLIKLKLIVYTKYENGVDRIRVHYAATESLMISSEKKKKIAKKEKNFFFHFYLIFLPNISATRAEARSLRSRGYYNLII